MNSVLLVNECIKYITCYLGWYILSYINVYIFNYQSKGWLDNNINLLNAVVCISTILYEIYNDIIPTQYSFYYYTMVSFFIYDFKNTDRFSIFWMHHILTTGVIYTIQCSAELHYMKYSRNSLFIFEIGNLSLYIPHIMNYSVNKLYWAPYNNLKILKVFTLIWYIVWRCINPLFIIINLPFWYALPLYIFTIASWVWAIKLYKDTTKSFSIKHNKPRYNNSIQRSLSDHIIYNYKKLF
jgi:hypothetical protein